jgi:sterol desaturase/sphingolipid hydroxylase (fatty acid hydroxylase superfamily)
MPPTDAGATNTADAVFPPPTARAKGAASSWALIAGLVVYLGVLGLIWRTSFMSLPDVISLRLGTHAFHLANIHARIVGNGMVVLLILPGALWLECLLVGWRGSSFRQMIVGSTASIRTDMAIFLLSQAHLMDILGKVMMLGASMISGIWLRDWIRASFGVEVDAQGLPLPLQIMTYFLVYTFFDYWTHRLDHTHYFWPLHRYHHAAREFCVVNAAREHPAAFASVFLINVPMAVLGASPGVMIFVNIVTTALGFLIHSRIDSDWGWIGRYVVQSPTHHRLHHKLDMSYPTGHFAMAPIWDHLFGTWYGDADQSLVIGVETPYRHGLWVAPDLARDYWDFWRGWFRRRPG